MCGCDRFLLRVLAVKVSPLDRHGAFLLVYIAADSFVFVPSSLRGSDSSLRVLVLVLIVEI